MTTAADVMHIAESYIGAHEQPLGSNNILFNTDYYGGPVYGPDYPWCCAFVWDIFRMADASELFYYGQKTAYCPTVAQWAYQEGLDVPYEDARYGDLVLFDWDQDGTADHIGFVEGLNPDGTLHTLEGNTSDADHSNGGYVLERTRYPETICMIVRIQYDEGSNSYMFEVKEIRHGDHGKDVNLAQRILRGGGYIDPKTRRLPSVDSSFGDETERCVIYFQKKNGLPQTGVIDIERTWPKLLRR